MTIIWVQIFFDTSILLDPPYFHNFWIFFFLKNDRYTSVFIYGKINNVSPLYCGCYFYLFWRLKYNTISVPQFLDVFSQSNNRYSRVVYKKNTYFHQYIQLYIYIYWCTFHSIKNTLLYPPKVSVFGPYFKKMTDILEYFRKQKPIIFSSI